MPFNKMCYGKMLSKNGVKMLKEKRINRIKKKIKSEFFNDSTTNVTIMRTMKCKILTQDLYDKIKDKKDLLYLTKEQQTKLDILLNDADAKRQEVLKEIMKMFYADPINLLEHGAQVINITKNNYKLEKIDGVATCKFLYKTTDDKGKDVYFTSNIDMDNNASTNIKMIKVQQNKDSEIYEISKFSAQTLYNWCYTTFAKGNSYKNYSSARFYEDVLYNVAKEVCSFLDKYYTIQSDISKTIKENEKIKGQYDLPNIVSTKTENDNYNKIVAQNKMKINLYNQINDEKLQFFKRLKGFPSFPLVEKQTELNYNDLDTDLTSHIEPTKEFFNKITKEQLQDTINHFYRAKGDVIKNIRKLLVYYYNITFSQEPNHNEGIHDFTINDFKQNTINALLERIDKKINGINKDKKDVRSEKALTEWYRGKGFLLFEYLRQKDHNKFAEVRADFDLKSSINTGFMAKDRNEKKVLEITGFSAGKKAAILKFDNQQYSLAFNVSKDHSEFKVGSGLNKGYVKTDGDKIELKNIDFDKEGTFVLPLAIGTRLGREYFYNFDNNFENEGQTINNARIVKDGDEYYIMLTFTKLKGNNNKDFDNKYETIIGVDRGEVLPIVLTISDLDGKKIETITPKASKDFAEKQKRIDDEKKKQQEQKGNYDKTLKSKAKNLADKMVEQIGAELLYYAIKYKGLIVFEDLNRDFGVSPIMANRQYTKIEDFLVKKLKENGLCYKGEVKINQRDGYFAKVIAQYTSKTCSNCGHVFSSNSIKELADELYKKGDIWYAKIEDVEIALNIEYDYYVRAKGRMEHSTGEQTNNYIDKLKNETTKKAKEELEKLLVKIISPRKTQDKFICPICGHSENADEQASLNIARRWIFEKEGEVEAMKNGSFVKTKKDYKSSPEREKSKSEKMNYPDSWEAFCKRL